MHASLLCLQHSKVVSLDVVFKNSDFVVFHVMNIFIENILFPNAIESCGGVDRHGEK